MSNFNCKIISESFEFLFVWIFHYFCSILDNYRVEREKKIGVDSVDQ